MSAEFFNEDEVGTVTGFAGLVGGVGGFIDLIGAALLWTLLSIPRADPVRDTVLNPGL